MPAKCSPSGIAFVLIDGVGDVNIAELGFLTPLQAASTPTLDANAGANPLTKT